MGNGLVQHGRQVVEPFRAKYTGTDQLGEGYCLCFDQDSGTAASADNTRTFDVEKPSVTNCNAFAGVVLGTPPVGPCYVTLAPPGSAVNVYAKVSGVVDVTRMTVCADQYYMYTGGFAGAGSTRCLQTYDRSGTAGLIQALLDVGPQSGGVELFSLTTLTTGGAITPMCTGVTFFPIATIGADATFTLADGTHLGQKKAYFLLGTMVTHDIVATVTTPIFLQAYAAGPLGLTAYGTFTMDAVGESLTAEWKGKGWACYGSVAS